MEFYPQCSESSVEDQRPKEFAKELGVEKKPIAATAMEPSIMLGVVGLHQQ
jgi:hypothetical protein